MKVVKLFTFVVIGMALLATSCAGPAETPGVPSSAPMPSTSLTSGELVHVHNQSKTGHISQNEIWSGTIHVTGDIWLDDDITLTIMPGTTVLISAGKDDQNRGSAMVMDESDREKHGPISTEEYAKSHIEINGRIIAVGIPGEMIVFTSDSSNPDFADWSSIELRPGSRMEYCIVEYAGRAGVGIWSNIPKDDSVLISNSIVRHIFMGGIALGGTTCARVISNEVSDCGCEGINVDPGAAPYIAHNTVKNSTVGIATVPGSSAIIENNILIDNIQGILTRAKDTIRYNHISSPTRQIHEQSYMGYTFPYIGGPSVIKFAGIVAAEHCSSTIEFNEIVSNDIGILIGPGGNPPQTLRNNNIYDNGVNNIDNHTALDIAAQNNWWGTTDTEEIEAKIHDYDDDPSVGEVNYQPIATAKIAGAGPQD